MRLMLAASYIGIIVIQSIYKNLDWRHYLFYTAFPFWVLCMIYLQALLTQLVFVTMNPNNLPRFAKCDFPFVLLFDCMQAIQISMWQSITGRAPQNVVTTELHLMPVEDFTYIPAKDPTTWNAEEIALWLKHIGLQQYTTDFKNSGVTAGILLELDEKDMKTTLRIQKPLHLMNLLHSISTLKQYRHVPPIPLSWGITDVCFWFEKFGYGYCKENIKKYAISGSMFLQLTDEQLSKKLKMKNAYHRRGVLAAIKYYKYYERMVADPSTMTLDTPLAFWNVMQACNLFTADEVLATYSNQAHVNAVNGSLLMELSETDLMQALGITNSIHMKKLIKAIAQRKERCTNVYEAAQKPLPVVEDKKPALLVPEVVTQTEDKLCAICCDKPKEMAFKPCGHYRCCKSCAEQIQICPWCKQVIMERLKIFTD